jgi:hypothetical protein
MHAHKAPDTTNTKMSDSQQPPPPPLTPDAITAPLAVVDALFAAAGRPGTDGDWGVAAYFGALAADPALSDQVRGMHGQGARAAAPRALCSSCMPARHNRSRPISLSPSCAPHRTPPNLARPARSPM